MSFPLGGKLEGGEKHCIKKFKTVSQFNQFTSLVKFKKNLLISSITAGFNPWTKEQFEIGFSQNLQIKTWAKAQNIRT